MFKIESYVTPILLSYVDKYVRDFKPADAQVSLWGGGVALHNLVLKADVLQQEVALPFTLVSGRIHELLIQVPWTKIMSEPIVVTIDTIECVLSLNPPVSPDGTPPPSSPSRKTQVVEAPPGYMQALVRRIVSNIALRVHHLIVKYVQDDIVLSLNVKHLGVDSAGPNWEPSFADIDQAQPVIRRLVHLDDLTLCLDKSDGDGKIRFFQEPLLYKCRLDLRVLTRLVSANTRRATSLNVQMRSSKLAWSVTNEQLTLLLRLVKEHSTSSNSAEPTRQESWSEWAWSWLPTWVDRDVGVEEAPLPPISLPIYFSAYLDEVSLVFKMMEMETGSRKRSRAVLEMSATFAAMKTSICHPTYLRVRLGAREANLKPTIYVKKIKTASQTETEWTWPKEVLDEKVEVAEVIDENFSATANEESLTSMKELKATSTELNLDKKDQDDIDELWNKMAPLVFLDYLHERSPPYQFMNPYENPPKDFEYSDWGEECSMTIAVEPLEFRVCMGLIHRLQALRNIYNEHAVTEPDLPKRVLTVEEKDSLTDNLPQRRIKLEVMGALVRVMPWNHNVADRQPVLEHIVMELELPYASAIIMAPMYPHRVCSAASQMPTDSGSLWQGARRHTTVTLNSVQIRVANLEGTATRPCARADIKLVTHQLLHKSFFQNRDSIEFAYHLKIKEMSICGSLARLQAAYHILTSLILEKRSVALRYTSLPIDALNDEAPDAPTTTPYLHSTIQWCTAPVDNSFDYLGVWTEPIAFAVDPLLIAWLTYKPTVKSEASLPASVKSMTQTQQSSLRRRSTPPSSSGRGGSRAGSGQGAELIHFRSRSLGSSSEPSEKKDKVPVPKIVPQFTSRQQAAIASGERVSKLYRRLQKMLLNVELGLAQVYVTMSTASAVDCHTLGDAMERHASAAHRVLAICLGRFLMQSNTVTHRLWQSLRHDGPTFLSDKPTDDSFPWKISIADVSCYTLELPHLSADVVGQEKVGISAGLKSKLKVSAAPRATRKTILELVTTTVTVSVVTKSLQYKTISRKDPKKTSKTTTEEDRTIKYFTNGMEFKPTTLKEFVRGPAHRRSKSSESSETCQTDTPSEVITITDGPLVSLGIHLHADTPPINIRLEQNQIQTISAAIHCLSHIDMLLKRPAIVIPNKSSVTSVSSSHKSLIRSVSEIEEIPNASEEDASEQSEIVAIYDRALQYKRPLKTFFWFQWVVSHATLVLASDSVKLALDIDDIISTVDLQTEYHQLKIKVASASIKHYRRSEFNHWVAGVIGGRVLEAREPTKAEEDTHFLSVTITQAQVADLPSSWKEELHPKLLESTTDTMWEVYATLAPLEAIIQPSVIDNIMTLVRELVPKAFCPLKAETENRMTDWQWPYFYLIAGGIRLVIAGEHVGKEKTFDDTIILYASIVLLSNYHLKVLPIGAINIVPHPENPICRRAVNAGPDGGWLTVSGGFEGRQYEVVVKEVSVKSTKFRAIALAETILDNKKGATIENPALKWTQRTKIPQIIPILHSVELCCVLAPAMYIGGVLACGPAIELNLVSDCSIELSVEQLVLFKNLHQEFVVDVSVEQDRSCNAFERARMSVDNESICPYANTIMNQLDPTPVCEEPPVIENATTTRQSVEMCRTIYDSGVETTASSSKTKVTDDVPIRKSVSVAFVETGDASNFLEVFVTMGVIDLSLYVSDDGSPEVIALRPPSVEFVKPDIPPPQPEETQKEKEDKLEDDDALPATSRSITEMVREVDIGTTLLNNPLQQEKNQAREYEGNIPLIQVTLFQPNVYYWKRKTQKTLQLSLFNAGVALGMTDVPGHWHSVLLSTAKGVPDPTTDIPPALATFKAVTPTGNLSAGSSSSTRGTVRLDIERPVQFEVTTENLRRLRDIAMVRWFIVSRQSRLVEISEGMEGITIQTSQISASGHEGIIGWDSFSLQITASSRPERLNARGLVSALLVAAGPPGDRRHVILQPLMLGFEEEANWEAWRRAEGWLSMRVPTVKINVELDDVTVDLRPSDLATLHRLEKSFKELTKMQSMPADQDTNEPNNTDTYVTTDSASTRSILKPSQSFIAPETESCDHFYKDDLRSGAFKILSGGQLPMAYQVMLHGSAEKETSCVLELYNSMLSKWESHTYFKIPVGEPKELSLFVRPPETVFAIMWRFRVCEDPQSPPAPYEFVSSRFLPRTDPLVTEDHPVQSKVTPVSGVTAEQLGAMYLEGYYVSKPLMRTHRVLSLTAQSTALHTLYGSPAGTLVVVDTNLSCDIIDCSTGTMEQMVEDFRVQGGLSCKQDSLLASRSRVMTTGIHVALQIPRLRTLQSLHYDWKKACDKYLRKSITASFVEDEQEMSEANKPDDMAVAEAAAEALEGRVSLWIYNSCASAMRVGQEDTDEVVPLGPGARLAYRWRSPTAPKRLRLALADPGNSKQFSCSKAYVHVKVEETGATRNMHLSGRLVLANMLRAALLYKVRAHSAEASQWRTVCSGEMASETVGRSVICSTECEMVLKIKLRSHNTCWSGDIPLKECPKENVPWLVKGANSNRIDVDNNNNNNYNKNIGGPVSGADAAAADATDRPGSRVQHTLTGAWHHLRQTQSVLPIQVALLTLYYEIKKEINVLGVSASYVLINRLDTELLVSALAVPNDVDEFITLRPKAFKVVLPVKDGRYCNHYHFEYNLKYEYLKKSFDWNCMLNDVPIVVTQIKSDDRWLVVVAPDPCPQFLVHNHTRLTLAVAQPVHLTDEPSTSNTEPVTECAGTRWWCVMPPNAAIHYSTPAHCARFPPEGMPATSIVSCYLTFAKGKDELEQEWCSPVVAADGEHLLQYSGGITIKLRVRTHPHSTLLELQDVDHNDISASDIRRRLLGAFESDESVRKVTDVASLERVGAACRVHSADDSMDNARKKSINREDLYSASVVESSPSRMIRNSTVIFTSDTNFQNQDFDPDIEKMDDTGENADRFRCIIAGVSVELSAASDVMPLLAVHLDRTALLVQSDSKKVKTVISVADAQIDNLQYETGQYDFAVIASTRSEPLEPDQWPPLWNMFAERNTFAARADIAKFELRLQHDKWEVVNNRHEELTEVDLRIGTLALYVEDAYVKALVDMSQLLLPSSSTIDKGSLSEERSIQRPIRLRVLHIHPLDLTLTLHTASPLRLSAFKLHDMMTSAERLTHALTVHYLSAAILGAGWVVGGLELLGAPGALAARLGGATGGVRGVASAAAAALLRSLSAWAGSLARNLDLLAGDEEHARRAAAARRKPPPSFVAGLVAGITNFAINILGAVGGLAHHPLVGVAVGETESGAVALRRGILGALTKPLSATADLVAYAGSGLLRQTGWDPIPEPRRTSSSIQPRSQPGWHRDCVRWVFRICELSAFTGFEVLLDNAPLQLLITHKVLIVAEPESERIVEMIDLRFCTLSPYQGHIIELCVMQRRQPKLLETRVPDEDEEFQISAAAMARVARYTGAEGSATAESRVLSLLPPPRKSYALHAALAAALHHNSDSHFPIL
ncbi:hypothetical protein HF086_016744 [Spodoptera exigua]|uniref:Chorein N-terminal domain-containing protein n=1 Tax=Spodoptera exigua TaxID=7107 RepID=A0A922MW19_SPOEX|nr:hypothetical protein HF086_016744 [Spodoptera exigua]